jgi:hypothetical protein
MSPRTEWYPANRVNRGAPAMMGAPAPGEAASWPPKYRTPERYGRYEATAGFVAVANDDATVITFSGRPDSIVLHALVGAVLVTLTDRLDRQTHVIPVGIGETLETHIAAERVIARENVADAGATLSVVGKWALPPDVS